MRDKKLRLEEEAVVDEQGLHLQDLILFDEVVHFLLSSTQCMRINH